LRLYWSHGPVVVVDDDYDDDYMETVDLLMAEFAFVRNIILENRPITILISFNTKNVLYRIIVMFIISHHTQFDMPSYFILSVMAIKSET
jgi:hypothetical protein